MEVILELKKIYDEEPNDDNWATIDDCENIITKKNGIVSFYANPCNDWLFDDRIKVNLLDDTTSSHQLFFNFKTQDGKTFQLSKRDTLNCVLYPKKVLRVDDRIRVVRDINNIYNSIYHLESTGRIVNVLKDVEDDVVYVVHLDHDKEYINRTVHWLDVEPIGEE